MTTASPQRTLWLALGGIVAVAAILWTGFVMAGWTIGSVTKNEHHVLRGAQSVTIDGTFTRLTLLPGGGDQVVVDSHAKGSLWLPKVKTTITGDRVHVQGDCHFAWGSCKAEFVMHVPAGMPVSVSTGSGDVVAGDLTGPITLDVGSGDLDLRSLSGVTKANVSSGDISAAGLSGPVQLRSSSGDISAAALRAPTVSAHATSGDVFVDSAIAARRITASATSGDVEVTVPRGVSYDAQADATSGDHHVGIASDPSASRSVSADATSGDADIRYRVR
jgi:hypothetical protein